MKFRIVQLPCGLYDAERKMFGIWFSVFTRHYFRSIVEAEDYVRERLVPTRKPKKEKKRVVREYTTHDLLVDKLKGIN